MAFRALYSLNGGAIPVKGYTIAASEAWDRGDCVAWNASGALLEPTGDSVDVLGYALEPVTGGASEGPRSTIALVVPFSYGVVYATTEVAGGGTPVVADIGEIRDLDLQSGEWGIHASASATAATPNFRIVDIDTIRNEWHVVIAPLEVADVFQWIDGVV